MFRIEEFAKKLENGRPVIGTHVKWSEPNLVDLFSMMGYDYIWLDGEHGSMSLDAVNNNIRIAQGNGSAAFYRVAWNDPVRVKPILEMGPDGIVFPYIRSAREAEQAVSAMKYPPNGVRGYAPARAMRYGITPLAEYLEQAERTWTILQIEHIDAVNDIENILSVEGVDAFIVGMMDLSASMGRLGQFDNPEFLETLEGLTAHFRKHERVFGVATSYNPVMLERWISWGGQLIGVGGEEEFLVREGMRTLEAMRSMIKFDQAGRGEQ